jgi:hypothetical protein
MVEVNIGYPCNKKGDWEQNILNGIANIPRVGSALDLQF